MEKDKDEEVPNCAVPSKKDEISMVNLEVKTATDAKNSQAKIVRGTKKMRVDATELSQSTDKKETKDEEGEAKIVRSLKRSCELWSMEDKNTFFKAVNEYAKDFDALQSYFLNQGKKKGLPENMIKNKEQIRHFYYRTWLKISKNLKFSDDVKKASQEIYGLINYGELRRKLPRIHEKVLLKLNELIYWGSTQVRLRGKTMRIKTPICRALRRLNQLEDWQEEIKLPSRVTIELRPGNNLTWWKVQANAMNPRVRTLLPIQRRLSSLLGFLQQRWKPAKYLNVDGENAYDSKDHNELLRVAPTDGCKISLPMVNLGEYLTSNSVSFNSYEQRLGLKSSRVELLGNDQQIKNVGKKSIKKKIDKRASSNVRDCDHGEKLSDVNSDIDGQEMNLNNAEKSSFNNNLDAKGSNSELSIEPNRFPGRETIDRIRLGWNIDEANTITIGDLFLMFGRESKIVLEYWWDSIPKDNKKITTENAVPNESNKDDRLCLALQKLLSIAKHNYGTSKGFDNTSSSNETVISSRVPSTKESTFRRPLIPQVYHKMGSQDAFKTQLDKFTMRFCKRGRTVRQRNLIVQRTIPPGASRSRDSKNTEKEKIEVMTHRSADDQQENMDDTQSINIDLSTNPPVAMLDAENHFQPSNSIITSATQILKEGEGQWLNSEVADYSLSSFLGQFESPIKGSQRSQLEVSRPSSDVVSQMQGLMGENSVDYMAKFANLASQIASHDQD
ncbi:hypothetical protein PV327_006598 [Microctonus hyperodae]|uniref:Protein cramped n=1 Tax=Microctonus hyperodae TaxID=165561 RepID=A0AA39F4R3_MICHY|nr:hypothetical protein PV327_006598 [Microctonus hyperodae]